MQDNVYIVAPDAQERDLIDALLRDAFAAAEVFESAEAFLAGVPDAAAGCAVVTADLPDGGVRRMLDEIRRRRMGIAVVVIGRDDDLPAAVDFVRRGAAEFVEAPMRAGRLARAVRRALTAARTLPNENMM